MRTIFLFLAFLFLLSTANSQVVFNKRYAPQTYQMSRNVVIQDSSYWSLGGIYFNNILEIGILKTDLEGNLEEIKHYGCDSLNMYHGSENSLKETGTGTYILGGARYKPICI